MPVTPPRPRPKTAPLVYFLSCRRSWEPSQETVLETPPRSPPPFSKAWRPGLSWHAPTPAFRSAPPSAGLERDLGPPFALAAAATAFVLRSYAASITRRLVLATIIAPLWAGLLWEIDPAGPHDLATKRRRARFRMLPGRMTDSLPRLESRVSAARSRRTGGPTTALIHPSLDDERMGCRG